MSFPRDISSRVLSFARVPWLAGLVLLFLGSFTAVGLAENAERVALVIGNGAYTHVPALKNPPNDAKDIAAKLSALGFDVTAVVDQTLEEIHDSIVAFGRKSMGAKVVLIFYAGHGLQVDGENYLLPVDGMLELKADLGRWALREADLHVIFAFVDPELALLILDACRDNPFVGAVASEPGLTSGSASAHELGRTRNKAGGVIAFAAQPGMTAGDEEDGNSPYTTALLGSIDLPGLDVLAMFRRVGTNVEQLTDGKQVPWVEQSVGVKHFYLHSSPMEVMAHGDLASFASLFAENVGQFNHPIERRAASVFVDRLVPDATARDRILADAGLPPPDTDPTFVQQGLAWLSIFDSDDPEQFHNYLTYFPGSPFGELAAARLAQLAEPTPEGWEAAAGAQAGTPAPEPAPDPAIEAEATAEERFAFSQAQRRGIQRLLAGVGFYSAGFDGAIGPASRRGIGDFQAEAGLKPTGYVGPETLAALVARGAPPVLRGGLEPDERLAIHQLAAISSAGPGAEPTIIRVASYQRFQSVLDIWQGKANVFEAEHPGTMVRFDMRPLQDYRENLLAMLGASAPPDIYVTWGGGHLRALVDSGFARDLTDEMADGWALSFKPGALANLIIDDRIFAVPARMTLVSLWANRRLLEAGGVSPRDFETWAGLLGAMARLKAAGITPISVGAEEGWPIQLYWSSLAQVLAGRAGIDAALAGSDRGFDDPAFVEAGELFRQLAETAPFQADYTSMNENQSIGVFTDGYAAMTLNGDWIQPRLLSAWRGGEAAAADDLVRIDFPPPDLKRDAVAMTYGGVGSWVVRPDSPDLAVEFLRDISDIDVQAALAEEGFGVPTIAGADGAIADPVLEDVAQELTFSEYHQLFLDQVLGPTAGEALNDAVVALAEGGLTPEETARQVETAWAPIRQAWGITTAADAPALLPQ